MPVTIQNPAAKPQVQELCRGSFNLSAFHLVSPGYPDSYPPGVNCEWEVVAPSASVCGLDLHLGTLRFPSCDSAQLLVGDTVLCGLQEDVVHLPFLKPQTKITFRGEGGEGFNISVLQTTCSVLERCGGEVSEDAVVIKSPGYPKSYPGDVSCLYTIKPKNQSICKVEVTFGDFSLESSQNCSKDSLAIFGELHCGDLSGVKEYPFRDNVNISFKSDNEGSGRGFKIKVRQLQCPNMVPNLIDIPFLKGAQNLISVKADDSVPLRRNEFISQEGYDYQVPFMRFSLPNGWHNHKPLQSNNPFNDLKDYNTPVFTSHRPLLHGNTFPSYISSPESGAYHPKTYLQRPPSTIQEPVFSQQFIPPTNGFLYNYNLPDQQNIYNLNQCCGNGYFDSHFLIISPGFPRSHSSDCIYIINRFSQNTNQIRFQFRYFWLGEDLGNGCSGGYLEIDGTRFCGCKTGLIWTTDFFDSETTKTLHLKLFSTSDHLLIGFIIEVYQVDSYSRRYKRVSQADSEQQNLKSVNFSQQVETKIERYPVFVNGNSFQSSEVSEKLIGETNYQSWPLPMNFLCLRWNFRDWLLVVQEALWARYQCPSYSSTPSEVVDTQSTACRTCQYFCHQNCQCCY